MLTTLGFDISRYQGLVDFPLANGRGIRFSVNRATIGDYYTDSRFEEHWAGGKEVIQVNSAYLVVAPADGAGRRISADAHLRYFEGAVRDKIPSLGRWVMDCELARGENRDYITGLTKDIALGLWSMLNQPPIIYTRQTWWDYQINPDPLWELCDLWAARYKDSLTGPWSDGQFMFRDWDRWVFWQFTSTGNGPYYGTASQGVDLDYFNGDHEDLLRYAGMVRQTVGLQEWAVTMTDWAIAQGYSGPRPDTTRP